MIRRLSLPRHRSVEQRNPLARVAFPTMRSLTPLPCPARTAAALLCRFRAARGKSSGSRLQRRPPLVHPADRRHCLAARPPANTACRCHPFRCSTRGGLTPTTELRVEHREPHFTPVSGAFTPRRSAAHDRSGGVTTNSANLHTINTRITLAANHAWNAPAAVSPASLQLPRFRLCILRYAASGKSSPLRRNFGCWQLYLHGSGTTTRGT